MYEEKKKSLLGTILTCCFFSVGIFIICCFIFRSCKMSDVPLADDVLFDSEAMEIYKSAPEDFKVYTYGLRKRFESVDENYLLQVKYMYYIPAAKKMQVTVKYNTVYADAPTDNTLPFKLILKNEKSEEMTDYFYEHDVKNGYAYIRVCYNGVEVSDMTEYTLYVNLPMKDGTLKQIGKFIMQDANSTYGEIDLNKKTAPALFENQRTE